MTDEQNQSASGEKVPIADKMEERRRILGFEPQKESIYNKLLPYGERLDVESNEQLSIIKANLARTVELRDIKIGASHWTGQLSKYIRLHGLKFSKEDHLIYIKLLFELTTIPDLSYSLVQKFAQVTLCLLKKRELITRDDLEIPWRPLYKLLENVVYSQYEYHGLVLFPQNIENVLKSLIRTCRLYFSESSTAEMLEEWRPLMCPFDMTMLRAMYFLELFLPTHLPLENHDQGFRLWFDEFMGLYLSCQNAPSWEGNLVRLFARLAIDTTGYLDWEPYIPQIFTRILRSFSLPVGGGSIHIGSSTNCYDVMSTVWWIIAMMGGGSSCQDHLKKMFRALESFYHPSNTGKWNNKLMKFMAKLPQSITKRLHRERYKKTWLPPIPDSHKLTNEDITEFVHSMKPIVFLAMFSKVGSHDSAMAFKHLAVLRPEIIIPPLLERTYPALETLTEPHRLVACLQCVVAVARPMLGNHRWFPEGRNHIIPLLNHCLPGIDTNDIKKCLTTFQLISTVVSLVPLVDCSEAVHCRTDLTEDERELCFATTQFEDFVLQFIDRVIGLIENSQSHNTHSHTTGAPPRLTPEETMLEVGLLSTFNAIVQQSSEKIYEEILNRIFRFATNTVYEVHVAGRYTADLVRAAVKVNPEKAMKKFVMHFCEAIKNRAASEDLAKEEHLDNEFLWNLKLLSECVRSDGQALLPYIPELKTILKATLHLKCKEGAEMAGTLLRHILKALSLTYTLDYRSTQQNWNAPLTEHLPIRDWGKAGDVHDLNLSWHVVSEEEKKTVVTLLEQFLIPELDTIEKHVAGTIRLDREDLQRHLTVILHCLVGAGVLLQSLQGTDIKLIDSLVDLTRFDHVAGIDDAFIQLNGENVRMIVSRTMRSLVTHMLTNTEDYTNSFNVLIKVYRCLLFFQGTQKEEFDARWKSLHIVKKSLENKLQGKKKHIRALLVDRVQLQHELRVINHSAKSFTSSHKDLFDDLFRLATSRYIEVRQSAQMALDQGFIWFAYSYKAKLDDAVALLKDDPSIDEHQFKGALYVLYGNNKRSMVTKRSWETMLKVWPMLIKAKHSEKPSLLKLIDGIADKVHKNVETTEISIKVHDELIKAASAVWSSSSLPQPSLTATSDTDIQRGLEEEQLRNNSYLQSYHTLVRELTVIIDSGQLWWKFHLMGLEMLGLLMRVDVPFPANSLDLFVKHIIDDNIQVRKICILATSAALKLQKRRHPQIEIDPYKQGRVPPPDPHAPPCPGDRPDNMWHHYDENMLPWTQEAWDKMVFVEKTHWGYSKWPRKMMVYSKEQPSVDRSLEQLTEEEKPVYTHFTDPAFIDKLIGFLSLEETKGKDKFHSKYFVLFKGLFRNYGDAFLPLLKPHIERMVADVSPDTHESNHRCCSEIIAGLLRGYKHWPMSKIQELWDWLTPVLRTALSNISVESVKDWGTCFATSSENRDPRKMAPLLELVVENPLRGEGGSFGDSSRLYLLQGALAQQEWRIPKLLHKFVEYTTPHFAHPYKNVRDRIGSVLVNIFLYDISVPNGHQTTSPRKVDFINAALSQLQILLKEKPQNSAPDKEEPMVVEGSSLEQVSSQSASPADIQLSVLQSGSVEGASSANDMVAKSDNGENEERKTAIRLFKTVMKWIQGNFCRMFQCITPEVFQFLPLVCRLQNESSDDELLQDMRLLMRHFSQPLLDSSLIPCVLQTVRQICQLMNELTDEELRHDCILSSAFIAKVLLSNDLMPLALSTVKQVMSFSQWHARAAILGYIQVMVFNNLFLVQDAATKHEIQEVVMTLLCDDQLEVRELAATTLGGFLHCGYMTMDADMMAHFEKLSSTKIKKKSNKQVLAMKPELVIKRHAGVLGLSACVQAYPYDVPEFIPQILMDLSDHLDDPQPIQMTVKKTLSNFKRTHHDNWQDHKQKFTDDQLVVLTDLLVSPNYYA